MKITPLLTRTILAASCLALAPLAVAQSPAPKATEVRPLPPPVEAQPVEPPEDGMLPVFNSLAGTLKTVVDALQEALDQLHLAGTNVLIATDAENAQVPALNLRHVSGIDALSLIAAAASCVVEPIRPVDGDEGTQPVGYKLHLAPSTGRVGQPASGAGRLSGGAVGADPNLLTATLQVDGGGGADRHGLPGSASGGVSPFGAVGMAGAGTGGSLRGGGVVQFTGGAFGSGGDAGAGMMSPSSAIETRVYPLAPINATEAFGEVMKTLDDVLSTSGVPKEQVKLAFHEKTKVLVVRGPAEAQSVVEQLLAALGKNNAGSSDRDATVQLVTMTVRLETMTAELDRLRKQIVEEEVERRGLEKENRRLQDQVPKKSDRQ